jgi:uracil-DNA glycosylase family 4
MQKFGNKQAYKIRSCEGYGELSPKIMLVGISAGKLGALQTGVPFTKDGSGRLMQRVLKELGYSKSDEFSLKPELKRCWITNLVKGRLLDEKGNNRLPTQREIDFWWDDFCKEVDKVQPERIIAVGKLVFKELEGKFKNVTFVMHPRWYFSHGAINKETEGWKQMLYDYKQVIEI